MDDAGVERMKQERWGDFFKNLVTENIGYKITSLVIALFLWVIVFNRKDFAVTQAIEVQFVVDSQQSLLLQTTDRVRLRLSGSRNLIKSYMDSPFSRILKIDMSGRGSGLFDVDITQGMLDIPKGIKVLSVRPNVIRVEISEKENVKGRPTEKSEKDQ